MNNENASPIAIMAGVTRNSKVISLNVTKLPMPVWRLFSGSTNRQPSNPPSRLSRSDSSRKLSKIPPREKPRTRSVPISGDRRITAAYIVFMAAKLLPTAIMTATKVPRYCIGAAELVCCA